MSSSELTRGNSASDCSRRQTSPWKFHTHSSTEPPPRVFTPTPPLCGTPHTKHRLEHITITANSHPVSILHDSRARQRVSGTVADPSPAHCLFRNLPSGCRFGSISGRTYRHLSSFFLKAITLLNNPTLQQPSTLPYPPPTMHCSQCIPTWPTHTHISPHTRTYLPILGNMCKCSIFFFCIQFLSLFLTFLSCNLTF